MSPPAGELQFLPLRLCEPAGQVDLVTWMASSDRSLVRAAAAVPSCRKNHCSNLSSVQTCWADASGAVAMAAIGPAQRPGPTAGLAGHLCRPCVRCSWRAPLVEVPANAHGWEPPWGCALMEAASGYSLAFGNFSSR